jgi:hypothetical protein
VVIIKIIILKIKNKPWVTFFLIYFFLLFICAYNVWVISSPFLPPPPFTPAPSLFQPTPSLPGRNYFALISDFVEERVQATIGRTKGFC